MDGEGKSWLQIPMRVNTVEVNSKESSMHKRLELRNTWGRYLYTCIIFQIRSVILQSSASQWFRTKFCAGLFKAVQVIWNVQGLCHCAFAHKVVSYCCLYIFGPAIHPEKNPTKGRFIAMPVYQIPKSSDE